MVSENLEKLENDFWYCVEVLEPGFGIDLEEEDRRGNIELPNISLKSDIGLTNDFHVLYSGSQNSIVLNADRKDYDVSRSQMAEEVAHWMRYHLGPRSLLNETVGSDFVESISARYVANGSVDEFFGRLGYNMVEEDLDRNLDEYSLDFKNSLEIEGLNGEDLRDLLLSETAAYKEGLRDLKSHMEHFAGYKAADQYYEHAKKDDDILFKSDDEIKEEYGIDELELEFARSAVF